MLSKNRRKHYLWISDNVPPTLKKAGLQGALLIYRGPYPPKAWAPIGAGRALARIFGEELRQRLLKRACLSKSTGDISHGSTNGELIAD